MLYSIVESAFSLHSVLSFWQFFRSHFLKSSKNREIYRFEMVYSKVLFGLMMLRISALSRCKFLSVSISRRINVWSSMGYD